VIFFLTDIVNLPMTLAILIGLVFVIYIILDGHHIGLGILFPFAPNMEYGNIMFRTLDAAQNLNQIWFLLGGILFFYAFPLTRTVLLPTLYIPLTLVLCGTILRIVAFKYKNKYLKNRIMKLGYMLYLGSILTGIGHGIIFGNFLYGVKDLSMTHILSGFSVLFWYVLLAATWLMTQSTLLAQDWLKKAAYLSLFFVGMIILVVCISMKRLFDIERVFYFLPIFILIFGFFIILYKDIRENSNKNRPFFLAIGIVVISLLAHAINVYHYIIHKYNIYQWAASNDVMLPMFFITVLLLTVLIFYSAYYLRRILSR
jgi:cytochrome d ubiquinol oxidase subunit II